MARGRAETSSPAGQAECQAMSRLDRERAAKSSRTDILHMDRVIKSRHIGSKCFGSNSFGCGRLIARLTKGLAYKRRQKKNARRKASYIF